MRRWLLCLGLLILLPLRAGAAAVAIAPEDVTWDGLNVVVWGHATNVVMYSESGEVLWECGPVTDDSCPMMAPEHGGEWVTIRAFDVNGQYAEFRIQLARHVELGKWSLYKLEQILQRIRELPVDVILELEQNLTVNVDSPGFQELQLSVEHLQMQGVFGDARRAAEELQAALDQLAGAEPDWENGPDYRGPGYTPAESAVMPCEPDELARLSICFPMHIGLKPQETYYFRMDIPQHIAEQWDSYGRLFRAVSWGIWIWFAAWLIRQFVPRFTA